ncbi:MAG: hypothetical protein ACI9J2_002354 [Saprospiraceae bacterium]|jgi:uncharacterized protein YajQ (UPF0234 family)
MPSFDIVSEVELHELKNAVDQASREVGTRFDFKGMDCDFVLTDKTISLRAEGDFQLKQMRDILHSKLTKRGIDIGVLDAGESEGSHKNTRQKIDVKEGLDADVNRKIAKAIKTEKFKVQTQAQDQQLRVTGKKRDDLQAVMQFLKTGEFGVPLQFKNFRD